MYSYRNYKPDNTLGVDSNPSVLTVCCAANCTDFSNFIFAIKQGGLDKTFDV